jgi:type IV pilus assembly protein PilW
VAAASAPPALAALKNDAALAGLGFFGDSRYLCDKLDFSAGRRCTATAPTSRRCSITAGVDADTVDVLYGERIESGANVLLAAASDGTSAELMSLLPISVGEAVLLAPTAAGNPCLVRTVTAVTASTEDAPQALAFDNTGAYNQESFTTAPAFAERDRITLLGTAPLEPLPARRQYPGADAPADRRRAWCWRAT